MRKRCRHKWECYGTTQVASITWHDMSVTLYWCSKCGMLRHEDGRGGLVYQRPTHRGEGEEK
jgi:hypothetical protein